MTFRVGQKVVCVAGPPVPKNRRRYQSEIQPSIGGIYTVRSLFEDSILLDEIINKPCKYIEGFVEICFLAWRFRPIVECKTSIEIFTRMLTDQKVDA